MAALKTELYKTIRYPSMIAVLVCAVTWSIVCGYFALRGGKGSFERIYAQADYRNITVVEQYGESFDSFEEYWEAYQLYSVPHAFSDSSFLCMFAPVFAATFFGLDFKKRTINCGIYAGRSRTAVILSKITAYLLCGSFFSLLSVTLVLSIYSPGWLRVIPFPSVLKLYLFHIIVDCGVLSIPIPIAVFFKDYTKTALCSFTVILGALHFCPNDAFFPPSRAFLEIVWADLIGVAGQWTNTYCYTDSSWIRSGLGLIDVSVVYLGASCALAVWLFKKADLG